MSIAHHFPDKNAKLLQLREMEDKAIAQMRWLESEKEKVDIGSYRTQWLWLTTEREKWLKTLDVDLNGDT